MSGRGVERVLDLIEWFAAEAEPASLARISGAMDLPKSSTLMMLRTLTERGYVNRDESGLYQLRRLPGSPGQGRQNHGALLALAAPHIAAAVAQTHESGFLAVMEGDAIRYLNKILPDREIRYDRDMTRTREAHLVASGIVILAASGQPEVEAYIARNQLADDAAATLRRVTGQARADGFYLNIHGVVEGASGVASALLDQDGHPVGAINISGPRDRMAGQSAMICQVTATTARAVNEELARRRL